MKQAFGIIALTLSLGGNVPYIIEILQRKVKPERISWLLWTILGAVYFFSTIVDTGATLFTLGEVLAPVIIFTLALKYGVGGRSWFDLICLAVAAIALALLFVTESALVSLLLSLFVDAIGITLTIRKLLVDPSSESRLVWGIWAVSAVFALLSLRDYTLTAILFPVYVLIVTSIIVILSKPAKPEHPKAIEKL